MIAWSFEMQAPCQVNMSSLCWDLVHTGFCPRGDRCRWVHVGPLPAGVAPPPGCPAPCDQASTAESTPVAAGEAAAACPEGVPSRGSVLHDCGDCRPCAWFHGPEGPDACRHGAACEFCHLCPAGELKRRKKDKKRQLKTMLRERRQEATPATSSSSDTDEGTLAQLSWPALPAKPAGGPAGASLGGAAAAEEKTETHSESTGSTAGDHLPAGEHCDSEEDEEEDEESFVLCRSSTWPGWTPPTGVDGNLLSALAHHEGEAFWAEASA